ncbi:MAG: HAMP domain-containing histidine kinase [Lachnospiraceae bacterium]|nr:HAMP domain-containing histidine kinase [Lachnospiraceae bacterium]
MRSKRFDSIRFQILLYSLLSIVLALCVDIAVVGVIYVGVGVVIKQPEEKKQMTLQEYQDVNTSNAKNIPQQTEQIHYEINVPFLSLCLLLSLILGLALFFSFFQMFTKRLIQRVQEISDGIDEITRGNLNKVIAVEGTDEFANIGEKINGMVGEIRLLMENERQYEREKDALITNVAHDLRTPLTTIIGYLDLVRGKKDLDPESRNRYITVAYDGAKRLEKLIEDLFEFTKVGAERFQVHLTAFDFRRFMSQMVEEFYPNFESAQLRCQLDLQLEEPIIEADADLLARGISNLFSNAVKYGKDGKLLKVTARNENNYIVLSIINYGKIIAPEDLEHIFDKFFRGEASRSTETGGSGLGLAIAKKVVLLHYGKITVSSDYHGTVFTISLPRKHQEQGEQMEQQE